MASKVEAIFRPLDSVKIRGKIAEMYVCFRVVQ